MKKHVILLANLQSEFADDMLDSLRSGGITVSGCQLSERLVVFPELKVGESVQMPPFAVVCEMPGGSPAKTRTLVQQVRELWAALPLVACAKANTSSVKNRKQLIRLGFRAVAESPAQLPALLREVEENPVTDDEQYPLKTLPDANTFALPASLRKVAIREAFSLIAALHLAANQKDAATIAVEGIARMSLADRWSIFVADQNSVREEIELELLATRPPASSKMVPPLIEATTLARQAVSKVEAIRTAHGTNWALAMPLVCGERVWGVLEGIRRRSDSKSFSRSEMALLNAMTMPVAAALSNSLRVAEAERLSLTDELTRLHNARYLRQFLVNEMKRARRFASKISALFLDLDDFKTINDLHGHLAGSHTLMEVASVILPSVRDTDCVVRYGGDEFVVILPQTGVLEAAMVADRIRSKIERHHFTGGRRLDIHLTSSIGVALFPDDALSPHQLIACADRAMYAAKAANKNCVRSATSADLTSVHLSKVDDAMDGPLFQRIPDEKFIS